MKIRTSSLVHALIGGAVVGAAVLAGQPAGDKQPPAPPSLPTDMQLQMAEWMKATQPAKAHEHFKQYEGKWDLTFRMWMDPKGAPMESSGNATFKRVLGGRFLQQDYTGTMMGEALTGIGLTGYDNVRNQYTAVWADTMSTTILNMSGGISPDGKIITMHGTMDEPTMKQYGKMVKWVTRWTGADTFFFEGWEVQYGEPFKVFEVEYRRAK